LALFPKTLSATRRARAISDVSFAAGRVAGKGSPGEIQRFRTGGLEQITSLEQMLSLPPAGLLRLTCRRSVGDVRR